MKFKQKDVENNIFEQCMGLLQPISPVPDEKTISKVVNTIIDTFKALNSDNNYEINPDIIIQRLHSTLSVETTESIIISAPYQHIEWLGEKRKQLRDKPRWKAIKKLLSNQLSSDQINEIDKSTDRVLSNLEDPERDGRWDNRGLVVGDVQSGKTTHYIALANRALDAGYKAVFILSGMHNNLRGQTQQRVEEGITGRNTGINIDNQSYTSLRCGVGKLPGYEIPDFQLATTRMEKGDYSFNNRNRNNLNNFIGVFKKNQSILSNVLSLVESFAQPTKLDEEGKEGPAPGALVKNIPLLLIDDEADNASINTAAINDKASKINGQIVKILNYFEKSAYVGYTATPFANILIDSSSDTADKNDLFPRNFIMTLGRPSNYIGPKHVFGLKNQTNDDDSTDKEEVYDWHINLDDTPYLIDDDENEDNKKSDWEDFMPDGHKRDHQITELPTSVTDSILAFIIGIAIRNLRNDKTEHKTMLIHVTRFTDVQKQICEFVSNYINDLYDIVMRSDYDIENPIYEQIEVIFAREFKNNIPALEFEWGDIKDELEDAILSLKNHVFEINGTVKDTINEESYPNGLNSIRIGGEKLSRGLTLPGLMVSYFLRTSKMYDTLMQMGRWFGYRDKYADICKIYTTGRLFSYYGHIAYAYEEMRDRMETMNLRGLTPKDYTQRIRSHPGNLIVTALNKQRHSKSVKVSQSMELSQLTTFDISKKGIVEHLQNLELISKFADDLKSGFSETIMGNDYVYKNIPTKKVTDFLKKFKYLDISVNNNIDLSLKYIKKMHSRHDELKDWTVVLFSNNSKKLDPIDISNRKIYPLSRKLTKEVGNQITTSNKALVSKIDEKKYDITENDFELAKMRIMEAEDNNIQQPVEFKNNLKFKDLTRDQIRFCRPAEKGLLLIYLLDITNDVDPSTYSKLKVLPTYGLSFPYSTSAERISYVINEVDNIEEFEDEE